MAQTTRSLFLPESYLGEVSGITPYLYDDDNRSFTLLNDLALSPAAFQFYEVSIIDSEGSWWTPTAANSLRSQSWPSPIIPLNGEGAGIWIELYDETVLRPQTLLWWFQNTVLANLPIKPAINQGAISGQFPLTGPQ